MHDGRAGAGAVEGTHPANRGRGEVSADHSIDDRVFQRRRHLADSARRRDPRQGYCRSVVLKPGSILLCPWLLVMLAVVGALLLFFGVTGSRIVRAAAEAP